MVFSLFALFSAVLGQVWAVDDALLVDDQCSSSGECSLELMHLRSQKYPHDPLRLINRQIEDNKKYEVSVQDENGATCRPEGGAAITCSETHKCCTSKRSYLAGSSHDSQPRLALYAICCPLDTHCKFDTIFVSCAAGVGPDDYSGVIAG
ncbi:unnamed protein product [Durusdinium trenchii]|uniref:Uncharacterized protein n=1 Tax=Durusdinium trenchii TaxID=1381693 RepID=A0ABP0REJ5_9DINO